MNYQPYTYLLKTPTGKFYYGVKYANNKHDVANPATFWVDYFTSCAKVKALRKEYPDDAFSFEIRRVFGTQEEARKWESKVNRRLTTKSDKFLNDSFVDGRDQRGANNGHYGKRHSEETKRKAVQTRRESGSYLPEAFKNRDRSYLNDEYRAMLSRRSKAMIHHTTFDYSILFRELDEYDFPEDVCAYKTKGGPTNKLNYFLREYFIPKYSHMYPGKTFHAACKGYMKRHLPRERFEGLMVKMK